jgi:hypothetical protein
VTAEYMTFAGLSQLFWSLIGLFALARVKMPPMPAPRETAGDRGYAFVFR